MVLSRSLSIFFNQTPRFLWASHCFPLTLWCRGSKKLCWEHRASLQLIGSASVGLSGASEPSSLNYSHALWPSSLTLGDTDGLFLKVGSGIFSRSWPEEDYGKAGPKPSRGSLLPPCPFVSAEPFTLQALRPQTPNQRSFSKLLCVVFTYENIPQTHNLAIYMQPIVLKTEVTPAIIM